MKLLKYLLFISVMSLCNQLYAAENDYSGFFPKAINMDGRAYRNQCSHGAYLAHPSSYSNGCITEVRNIKAELSTYAWFVKYNYDVMQCYFKTYPFNHMTSVESTFELLDMYYDSHASSNISITFAYPLILTELFPIPETCKQLMSSRGSDHV